MTDDLDQLKDALRRATPPASDGARNRALAAAREAHERIFQGSAMAARPNPDRPQEAGGNRKGLFAMLMKLTTRPALLATTATLTVGLAFMITSQLRDVGLPPVVQTENGTISSTQSDARATVPVALPREGDVTLTETARTETAAAPMAEPAPAPAPLGGSVTTDAPDSGERSGGEMMLAAPMEEVASDDAAAGIVDRSRIETAPGESRLLAKPADLARTQGAVMPVSPAPGILGEQEAEYQLPATSEEFSNASTNPIKSVSEAPVSTFSIDVDTASYAYVRSALMQGYLPDRDAVRVEELINYFDYAYARPDSVETPFSTSVTVMPTPWNEGTKLMQIGIQGYDLPIAERPPVNLVFLIDTSGSMNQSNKLPLLIQSFRLLVSQLTPQDSVAIVTYAGSAGMALEPTPANERATIYNALENLSAGGSTAGQAGLQQAYALAERMKEEGEVSRVILATDGDFNVGISDPGALKSYITEKRASGIYLSVLGFGRGNYQDDTMQALAQNGNGTAAYIDTLAEAQKVLVEQAGGALFPIANDVKIQVEFNPATIAEYRLIGYETRALNREDFNNDRVDAGEIGAGHSVTAIYEITPVGSPARRINDLRYQPDPAVVTSPEGEYAFLRLRYKRPGETVSNLIETPITRDRADIMPAEASFAAAVAGFGELLRGGMETGDWGFADARALAAAARGDDPFGYRAEFITLVRLAETSQPN